ncbi:MAG TPA: F0F1 ATP synthase subunit A [Anaerolineales bacterium]|nr:F0F1 ATP synthase subunit A [Anaerolineales bacterium]
MSGHDHAHAPRRAGFWRWIWLAAMIGAAVLAFYARGISVEAVPLGQTIWGVFAPVPPAVILPSEPAWAGLYLIPGLVPFTNTMASATIVLVLIALFIFLVVQPAVRGNDLVPPSGFGGGLYHLFEMGVEWLWNTAEAAAGHKWAPRIFPFTATIFLLVLFINLFGLVPIHETWGYTKRAHGTIPGYQMIAVGPAQFIDGRSASEPDEELHAIEEKYAAAGEEIPSKALYYHEAAPCPHCEVVPTLRRASTDLSFTLALALITVIMVQVFGVWSLGIGYFTKFFNLSTIIDKPFFGVIDFIVSLIELISEFAKILSLTLRLFGNMFAGGLLLTIIGSLTVFFVPGLFVGLEIAIGAIQAYVFSALALTFMSQATVSHHGDGH